jgi:hypothetical protein
MKIFFVLLNCIEGYELINGNCYKLNDVLKKLVNI